MNLRFAFGVGVIALAAAAAIASRPLVFAAAALLLLVLFVGYARRHLFDRLSYRRDFSSRTVVWGGELEMTSVVENRKWLPVIWLGINDQWPFGVQPLSPQVRATPRPSYRLDQTVSVRWFERVRRRYRGRCLERGVWSFGPASIEASDPFGLGGLLLDSLPTDEIVVLPKVLAVPGLAPVHGRPLIGVETRRSLARDPAAPVGVRPYRDGDPLRAVNWRATARRQALQTNEWEPTTMARVWLLLDARVYQFIWQGTGAEVVELLCVATASLAAELTRLGFAVGLLSNAYVSGAWRDVEVEAAPGALPEILEILARVQVVPPAPIENLLAAELARRRPSCEYLVVTAGMYGAAPLLARRLAEQAPLRIVYAGDPAPDLASLVEYRLPLDFDWAMSDVLPLA